MKKEAAHKFNEEQAKKGYIHFKAPGSVIDGVKQLFNAHYDNAIYIKMEDRGYLHGCMRHELMNEYHETCQRAYAESYG